MAKPNITDAMEIPQSLPLNISEPADCWSKPNTTETRDFFIYSNAEGYLAGSFAFLFSVGGIIFNLLIILAVLNHAKTRKQILSPFIISLASSDLLFSVVTLPFFATRFFARYVTPRMDLFTVSKNFESHTISKYVMQ